MKHLVSIISFFFISNFFYSQSDEFTKRYFVNGYNAPAKDMVATKNKGFAVIGNVEYDQNQTIPFIIYCDSAGHQVWSRPYGTFNPGFEFNRVIQLPDSSIVAVGKMFNPMQNNYGTACIRISEAGDVIWAKSISDNSGKVFVARDVIFTSDSALLIVGGIVNHGSFAFKMDLSGTKIWSKSYVFHSDVTSNFHEIFSVKEKSDSNLVFVGTSDMGSFEFRGLFFETNEMGEVIWLKRFQTRTFLTDLVVSNNSLFLKDQGLNSELIKTSLTGNLNWAKNYADNGNIDNEYKRLTTLSNGSFMFTNSEFTIGTAVNVDNNGEVLNQLTVFGSPKCTIETIDNRFAFLKNGPSYGVKTLTQKHFAVTRLDSLNPSNSACAWNSNVNYNSFTHSLVVDSLIETDNLSVFDAMMEQFSTELTEEAACIEFLGSVNELPEVSFELFPNPATEIITVTFDSEPFTTDYTILDQQGRLIMTGNIAFSGSELNVNQFTKGLYFFQIGNSTKRFIKN
ncbi:MAG: T9SS C-terminal target domain-containing protein [Flavobacteriales bacterium]|nr:T9SS C-terminal target domain-containing protein [Crocinitomicaceae bacterium]NBX80527.1 T9SS C-terminal target domain-containing protein [Flavobacteriales bacterium]